MGERNIFRIGRSRLGREDQLTEMLAYLWERHPELVQGWIDQVLGHGCPRVPGTSRPRWWRADTGDLTLCWRPQATPT